MEKKELIKEKFVQLIENLQEKNSPLAFFYFNRIRIPKEYKKKNEEWTEINQYTLKQTIFLGSEKGENAIICIVYELKKFKETSKELVIKSEKYYSKKMDIIIIGKEGTYTTVLHYDQEDYLKQIIKEDMQEKAQKEIVKENHLEQKKYHAKWEIFENWIPKELSQFYSQDKEFRIGDTDLYVKAETILVSRKEICKYFIEGLTITIFLSVKKYEINIILYQVKGKEIVIEEAEKYNFILNQQSNPT